MADAKITDLTQATSLTPSDLFAVVTTGSTKSVALSTLFNSIATSYQPYLDAAVVPLQTIITTNESLWTSASTATVSNSAVWSNHLVGTENTIIGLNSFENTTTGYKNTSLGVKSLSANVVGSGNVAVGYQTLFMNVSGSGNTAVGFNAGYANVIGNNNTYIGNQATGTCPDESNTITLGNGAIKTLRCQAATITSISDRRDKTNVTPLDAGLSFLNKLNPVRFEWNTRDKSKVGEEDIGFIAQDLIQAESEHDFNIPGLVNISNPDQLEASYGKLIPVLVKAIQELSAELNEIKKNR